mmetsp:Transcript_116283/g.163454  ORF Transcript_116283/g.163454 Transcript_116283/m.163454 type:complete len:116 (+) Transcript_116283:33-380(+)
MALTPYNQAPYDPIAAYDVLSMSAGDRPFQAPMMQPVVVSEENSVRVEKVMADALAQIDFTGAQLCAFAAELEEIKAEVVNANNLCDNELRCQLQQGNDEIYRLRNQLSELTEHR